MSAAFPVRSGSVSDVQRIDFAGYPAAVPPDIIVRIAGEYDPDLSLCAIRLAKERNANSAAYVLSILERWKAQGVTHIDQVKKQNQNAVTKKSAPSDYTDPALYQEEGDLDAVFGRYPKNKG